MFQKLSRKLSNRIGKNRKSAGRRLSLHRGLFIEPLESRQLLSVTLSSIGDQSVFAGAPLNLALDGTSDNPLTYTVQVSDSDLSATVSQDNPSIRITIDDDTNNIHGDVTIQLFEDLAPNTVDQIMALVDSGFYDGLTFHRIISDFMIQGGYSSEGPDYSFDDEFTPELQFTGPGLLAMANSGDDTNGSQFFITVDHEPTSTLYRDGDFSYTVFGMVTEGLDIVEQLSDVPTYGKAYNYLPVNDAVMTTVTVVDDTEDAVLRLSAEDGVTGTFDVTVTVTDTVTNQTDTETFEVTVSADTNNNLPFLDEIDPIVINDGQPAVVMIPGIDVEGDDIVYFVESNDNNITASIDENTGELTVTPANGVYGVFSVTVKVSYASGVNYSDTQDVPVYVSPPAPTSVTLISTYDAGSSDSDAITNLNDSAAGQVLGFEIEGVEIGALVQLYADGQLIGETNAMGTTVTIVTYGTSNLSDGTHEITVKQTMEDQDVLVGNLDTTVDLESELSSALTLTVDTVVPEITSSPVTTAYVEGTYIYQILATDDTTDLIYTLEQAPSGMTIDPDTGRITWTSITGEGNTEPVTVRATDMAGNYVEQSYDLSIAAANTAPMLTAAEPVIGTTDEDTSYLFSLSASIINNGDSTTMVTDADQSAVIGGIALIGWTGNGTWAYSFDGTTYHDIGDVSATSALLLPADATLRYTPDGDNGESAAITYVAWDGTTGHDGIGEVDTTSGGDHSAFSTNTDTATLNVTSVNDAPVLTPATPSAGDIDTDQSAVIKVSDYINSGDGTTTVVDIDADAVTDGIALIGLTGDGTWQYSLDGTSFVTMLDVSSNSALLLPGDAVLKYTPAGGGETVEVTYRAWDTVTGTAGDVADTTGNGGASSFSTATDTLTLTVNADTGSIAGFVYIDADNDGLRITPDGQSHLALQSVVVQLYKSEGQGNWTLVSTVSSGSDGSYKFDNLTSGTYRVREVQPTGYIDGRDTLGLIDGAKQGVVGADLFEIALAADDHGIEYNFGERGIVASAISLRLCLASAATPTQSVTPPQTDITAPSGYSITAGDSLVGSAESDDVSFIFSGAEVGTTYNYTVTSSGGDGEASGSGTIGSASHQVSGIDVSALPDGELTFSVTLTDASGNMGAAATASTTLDQTVPDGYSLVLDDDYLDENDADSISFQINNGEVGATFAYVIISDGGDGTVSGDGMIASTAHLIDGVDVSGLPDGTLSVKIALRDVAGNLGETVVETTTLDQVAPAGYSITTDEEYISQAESTSTSFTFADAEVGATYNYTISSSGGGTPVTGSGTITSATQTIDGIDVSSLPDGELTFSVTLTDIGNKTGEAVTDTAILDTVAPTGYTIEPFDATVDADSATDTGFKIYNALPGATYSYTITSDGGGTPITGSGTVSLQTYHVDGIDVSSLPDGLLTIALTLTDEAGNEGSEETATFTLDTSA